MKTAMIVATGLLALPLAAAAQAGGDGPGPYLLGAGGASSYETDCSGLDRCDSSAAAYKGAIGWRLGGGLAAEALVIDFGRIRASSGSATGDLQVRATGLGFVATSAYGPARLSLRLGAAVVRARGVSAVAGVVVDEQTEQSLQLLAGIAWGLVLTDHLRLEIAWDATRGSLNGAGGRVGAATAGLVLGF